MGFVYNGENGSITKKAGELMMSKEKKTLGIEFGSTRIKTCVIDGTYHVLSSGDHTWKSDCVNGVWTYDLKDAWDGLRDALRHTECLDGLDAMGVSAMMHGYLAFDKDWNLLAPFRTWQNTMTGQAAGELTGLVRFNILQRWSVAHLYQAILNGEDHIGRIAHITTLAGYIHHALTGENVLGVGEASGMFPIDPATLDYNDRMVSAFDSLEKVKALGLKIRNVLPKVLPAGAPAGCLTGEGAALLEGMLPEGLPFAPPEGDAGTGMTATNAVRERTGNVSAGTSIFSMVVLEKPLKAVHEEIDVVTTPAGKEVAMVHCNNCTNDFNAWTEVLNETVNLFGGSADKGELFTKLYQKSLEGDADPGMVVINYMAGEGVTHMNSGRPMVLRRPDSPFTLANFMRASLYSTMATLKIGMDILSAEGVAIDTLTGHGGLFKTPVVGQKYMAAACNAAVSCMETAGEGGPYGMALLAMYRAEKKENETLEDYLSAKVFKDVKAVVMRPEQADVDGFNAWMKDYRAALEAERCAVNG